MGYVRRKARNVPDIYGVRGYKQRQTETARVVPKPRLVDHDVPAIFGGKRMNTSSAPLPVYINKRTDPDELRRVRRRLQDTCREPGEPGVAIPNLKRRLLKMMDNPPVFTRIGPFKIY